MSAPPSRSPKILIVEDERITAHSLRHTLQRLGYEVVGIAPSAASAIQQVERTPPDLVIADIGLEGPVDGIELAARIRKQWGIPTVFLTAYGDGETMERARVTEPYGYLIKPFATQELQATIEIALQQSRLTEQRKEQAAANTVILDRTREDLLAVAGRLFSAQEDERQRIARDLHDDLNQRLAAVQIDIESTAQKLPEKDLSDLKKTLALIVERLGGISDDLRTISHQLHPSVVDDLGLPVALRQLADEFRVRHPAPVRFSVRGVPATVPKETALCLYRIAQEALRNIAKHAGPVLVNIALVGGTNRLHLSIRDAGAGFDLNAARKRGGLGLISMAQRAELLGGAFELDLRPGQGTQIHVHLPLPLSSNGGGRKKFN